MTVVHALLMLSNETNKRKAPNDEHTADANGVGSMSAMSNPLVNAAKKAKRESKAGALNKRKLANAEEAPGGLLIVRTQIPSSSSLSTANPPAKKFKSSQVLPQHQTLPSTSTKPPSSKSKSKPPSSSGTSSHLARYNTPDADPALDAAVRAMDTEAADLRRASKTPQTPDNSRSSSSSGSNSNPKYRFPTQTVAKSKHNGHGNGNGKRRETDVEMIIDVSAPLRAEEEETPQIQRNKNLRAGAMAAISGSSNSNTMDMDVDHITPPRRPSGSTPGSHRRKSSVGGRGKRISSSFQATGVITQPHNSVTDSSFYKHIDSDLPDADRVRQLLIWCSARAASSSFSSPSDTSISLPPLSEKAQAVLKATQEDIVRKLAERYVDLRVNTSETTSNEDGNVKENKQNVTNRTWEGVYSAHIQSAVEEEQAWKQVSSAYDAYARRLRSSIEKRRADLGIPTSTSTSTTSPTSPSTPTSGTVTGTPSAKAQGKQRALAEPNEHDLPENFRAGFRMARRVIARSRARRKPNQNQEQEQEQEQDEGQSPGAGPSTSTRKGVDPDSRLLPASQGYDVDAAMEEDTVRKEVEVEVEEDKALDARMADVEFKLDHLYVMASQARQTTEVAELALDWRFEVLREALDARRRPAPLSASAAGSGPGSGSGESQGGGGGSGGGVLGLSRYLHSGARSNKDREEADEAISLLRALARVDAARPPAQVGDAARRAVREVQRVGDAGGVGERRITEVPAGVGLTPRKMPGTPRRAGSTPGKGA